uniref:Thioredoxin domain-containing protein n=1 Tax=Heterorhabditis bacteriophora TaxID=37862 RepID=A0A1I7XKS7_HETBA
MYIADTVIIMQRLSGSLFRLAGYGINAFTKAPSVKEACFFNNFTSTLGVKHCSTSPIFDIESVEEFTDKVVNSPTAVIVDFHADWCGPCRVLGPRLEEKVYGRNGDVMMAKINVDYAGELATDYGITAVPTVMSFKNGERIGMFTGVIDDEEIDKFIDDVINN